MPRRNRNRLVEPQAGEALDRFKYEVAEELGLREDIERRGWENMTTREVGKIGGNMVRRMVEFAEREMGENGGDRDDDRRAARPAGNQEPPATRGR